MNHNLLKYLLICLALIAVVSFVGCDEKDRIQEESESEQIQTKESYVFWGTAGKIYFVTMPNKLFIQKDSTVTREYLLSLLDNVIDSDFEVIWSPRSRPEHIVDRIHEDNCEVIVNDALIDDIITELSKDDGVLVARRICAQKDEYEYGLQHPELDSSYLHYPYSRRIEYWFYNEIPCTPLETALDEIPSDSICNALGFIDCFVEQKTWITFKASKSADVIELSAKLYETGYFSYVVPKYRMPFRVY